MKKSLLLPFVLLLFANLSYSQCYTVLSVKGEIISEKTGQPIKEMDEVCATDKLKFGTKDSKAAVLSPEQGRFVIKFNDKKKDNSLFAFVSSVLNPGKEKLSTKIMFFDDTEEESLELFKNEFGTNYFIIKESSIFADKRFFPMNENSYFFVKYLYEGKEIKSKLKYKEETFYIDKDVFKNNGDVINPESVDSVSLNYFSKKKNESIQIATFRLAFANEEELKSELSNYISILKQSGKSDYLTREEVTYYLNDIYGNVNGNDVYKWLDGKFGLK